MAAAAPARPPAPRRGPPTSFGLVPWVVFNGKQHFLGQVSFSSSAYSLKVDPFRGKQEPREKPAETAARETWEESAHLLDFRGVSADLGDHVDGLFHVLVRFGEEKDCSQAVRQLMEDYTANRKRLSEMQGVKEVDGIAFVSSPSKDQRASGAHHHPRLAKQLVEMSQQDVTRIPFFIMRRRTEQGAPSWVAERPSKADLSLGSDDTPPDQVLSCCPLLSDDFGAGFLNRPEDLQLLRHERTSQLLLQYPNSLDRARKIFVEDFGDHSLDKVKSKEDIKSFREKAVMNMNVELTRRLSLRK